MLERPNIVSERSCRNRSNIYKHTQNSYGTQNLQGTTRKKLVLPRKTKEDILDDREKGRWSVT